MTMNVSQRCDILAELSRDGRDLYLVRDVIFQYLGAKDLKTVELVCLKWKHIVAAGSYWEKLLKRKVREPEGWREILACIEGEKPNLLQESLGHKKACLLISGLLTPKAMKVVFKGEFGCELNFKVIHPGHRYVRARDDLERTLEINLPDPHPIYPEYPTSLAKASVSRDGKFECVCQHSEEESKLTARKFLRIIRQIGHPQARLQKCQICHVMGHWTVKYEIDLLDLMSVLGSQNCTYHPETEERPNSAWLEYEMNQPKVWFCIRHFYPSSTHISLSAKSEKKLLKAFQMVYPILRQFKN